MGGDITSIFAHRGASGYEYENTFPAFDKALELGADGLETDCWLIADGTPVLHHDRAIKTEKGNKNITKLTTEELKKIKLPNGETVPTLREFLERYADKKTGSGKPVLFSIDLQDLKVGGVIAGILEEYGVLDRAYLCATSYTVLKKVRAVSPNALLVASNQCDKIGENLLNPDYKYRKIGVYAFNVKADEFRPEMKEYLERAGLKLFIWDLHSEETLRKYLPYRPYAIYSNYPDLAVKIRKELLGA